MERGRGGGRPHDLPGRLRAHLRDTGLIHAGAAVRVALSGGLDSVVLLHLLRFPLADLGLRLEAAHLDHAMRPGSDADAHWVRGLCRAWRVPLVERRLDRAPASEADARRARYAFLRRGLPEGAVIATAHHRDDQAETVLFRAIRGTGVRGLRGIAPRRGAVVRPLLPFRRAELEAWAASRRLGYRDDPTNRDTSLARNRLRHEVIPALEEARPGAVETLARLAERARATETALDAALDRVEAEAVMEAPDEVGEAGILLARPVLLAYHPALRARVLRRLLRRWGCTPDRAGTHAALEFISSGSSGGQIHLPGGVRLERDFDTIRITAEAGAEAPDRPLVVPNRGPGTGRARIGGRWTEVVWGEAPSGAGFRRAWIERPVFPLTVRGWRPGDRIRFAYGSKKLKKLFAERRLDRRARRRVPIVVEGGPAGAVLWVAGVARAEGVGEDGVGFQIAVRDAEQQ